jgi:CheY-like chemotaxis protein/predicted Ser/Thr protein kinase
MAASHRILLAMKQQRLSHAARNILQNAGFEVTFASTLRDALSEASSDSVDLIVCGPELDDVSGTSLLTFLKSDPTRERIPFVFLANKRDQAALPPETCLGLGAKDCIFYPIAEKAFLSRIQQNLTAHATRSPIGIPPDSPSMSAEVSTTERIWTSAKIINHTSHGAMIETGLIAKIGDPLCIKCSLPDGSVMSTGKLMHILVGDKEQLMGLGVNFGKDENWLKIHSFLKSPAEESKAGQAPSSPVKAPAEDTPEPPAPLKGAKDFPEEETGTVDLTQEPFSPISIQVSRDGNLWMPAKICQYSTRRASISTPMLGKPGSDLYLRCVLAQGQKIARAEIERISLDSLKMPAGLQVAFKPNDIWQQVVEFLDELIETLRYEELEEVPESRTAEEEPISGGPDSPAIDPAPPDQKDCKIQFYESLIGKQMGNYEIVSLLGAGSMGGVFQGWDTALERTVAIKIISYDLSAKMAFVDMFFREARYISQLNHPNISHVYYIGKEHHILYYAMEFVQGKSLSEIISQTSGIEVQTAVKYMVAICRALEHVWGKKIVHRDIKPANIMITKDGEIKILDFGVAQQYKLDPTELVENMAGSPPYICPEAIVGRGVDHRSDIYSLGATFYHALSGAPPFAGHSVLDIFRQHVSVPPIPLEERRPDIPARLSDIIDKMLAKEPENRFQTYCDIIKALDPLKAEHFANA